VAAKMYHLTTPLELPDLTHIELPVEQPAEPPMDVPSSTAVEMEDSGRMEQPVESVTLGSSAETDVQPGAQQHHATRA